MNEPIEDGVGRGWVADDLVPMFDGQLAGDDGAEMAVMAVGEAPTVTFAGGVQGALASAASREGQYRVLDDWHPQDAAGTDIMRLSVDAAMQRLAGALRDDRFIPVFGTPFLLTTQFERRSIGRLISQSWWGRVNDSLTYVSDFVFIYVQKFAKLIARIAHRTETMAWLAQMHIPEMSVDAQSQEEPEKLCREADRGRPDLFPEKKAELLMQNDKRSQEIRMAMLRMDLDGLLQASSGVWWWHRADMAFTLRAAFLVCTAPRGKSCCK